MEKRTPQEREKYQPSYDTTILSEVSMLRPWTVRPYKHETRLNTNRYAASVSFRGGGDIHVSELNIFLQSGW